ncbi:MAG TPA: DUF4157 domain-containing protein, partial [Anaerolineales bacterium]|nr:DUF4157 domain-containing protein [Anaerolineales bacterium]
SGSGQELLAHELTHVVQQGSGQVGGGSGGMTVNEPGDAHEQEADSVAEQVGMVAGQAGAGPVQMQEEDEMPAPPEGLLEEKGAPDLQRQGDVPEEEELVQAQSEELEEKELLEE